MELTVNEALQRGIAAHKAGRLRDAEKFYQGILQTQPDHPDANHNLGVNPGARNIAAVDGCCRTLSYVKSLTALEKNAPATVGF